MLVLSRKFGESVVIPELGITFTVFEGGGHGGRRIRVGIDAPRHLEIHRQEIWHKIKAERAALAVKGGRRENAVQESS